MKPGMIAILVAAALIVTGVLVGVAGLWMKGFEVPSLFGNEVLTTEYGELAEFTAIRVEDAEADVRLIPSEDGARRVVCREQVRVPYTVTVADGTLTVRRNDLRKWYHHIGIFWEKTEITVYLPKGEYEALTVTGTVSDVEIPRELSFCKVDVTVHTGDVRFAGVVRDGIAIETDTGKVALTDLIAKEVSVKTDTGSVTLRSGQVEQTVRVQVDTGRVEMGELQCETLTVESSTGRQELSGIVAGDRICLKSSTGDVKLIDSDAASLEITTSTGDVLVKLLSEKIFVTETSTGGVRVPQGTSGGICRIKTSTGDIEAY
ncbi:MAG: DUF4097 family beta strand repeat protein [Clostridia bacterium]|nr:DUF4097 family beta strand repeat protein [Clostridia bacterium]